jgi:hypothetical protein
MLKAVEINSNFLTFASDRLKDNKDFMLEAA